MDQPGTGTKGRLHVQHAVVLSQTRRWIPSGSGFLTPQQTTSAGNHQVQGNLRDVGTHRERATPILFYSGPFRSGLSNDAKPRASHHHRFHPAWSGSIPVDPNSSGHPGSQSLIPSTTQLNFWQTTRHSGARRLFDPGSSIPRTWLVSLPF